MTILYCVTIQNKGCQFLKNPLEELNATWSIKDATASELFREVKDDFVETFWINRTAT